MKTYAKVVSAIFLVFLCVMLAGCLLLPDKAFSETENRTLAQKPEFSWKALVSGKFTQDVETYLADQFPLRDGWITLKTGAEYLLGKREFNGVYLCEDTLISKVEEPDQEDLEKKLGYLQSLTETADVPVYAAFIPSAAEIWKEKLPDGASSYDQGTFLQMVQEKTEAIVVDLQSTLQDHKEEPIYYRTDHHWTSLGAYYGYCALLRSMGMAPVNLQAYSRQTMTEDFQGTLYSSSGVHWLQPDTIETYVPEDGIQVKSYFSETPQEGQLYDLSYLEKKDKYSMFLGGNQPFCVIENEKAPAGKILVVRDSYADSMAPFLSQSFSQVYLMDLRYYRASVADVAKEYDVDAIVVMYSIPNFLTDSNLLFLGKSAS